MLKEIEDAIVARLAPIEVGMDALKIVNSPKSGRANHKGQLLVYFAGKRAEGEPFSKPIVQQQVYRYSITVKLKDLRGHENAYPFLERIEELLTGFKPIEQAGWMFSESIEFVFLEEGFWFYSMSFAVRVERSQATANPDNWLLNYAS